MSAVIDTNIFLTVAFKDPGWEHCANLLDNVFTGKIKAYISTIQLSELYTPFKRAEDKQALTNFKKEIRTLGITLQPVTETIAKRSADYRSSIRTPEGGWLALADAVILATGVQTSAEKLYTLDLDFYHVETLVVTTPSMPLRAWITKYGTDHQRELLKHI